tara:strand:+ start:172 stop:495 length:324 start_codon:yes stop_codon:yes gene_type:complete
MSEEELPVITAEHPKSGMLTQFIEKDTALMLYARQQKTFVDIMQANHTSLETELREGFGMMKKVVLGGMASMTIFVILAFCILALLVGGKTSVKIPGGPTIEMGPPE